jgi:hypothetical protein
MSSKLRKYYENLLVQDTPFIERFGTPQQKQQWSDNATIIKGTNQRTQMVKAGNVMGSIRGAVHRTHEGSTAYRLLYLQRGPESYEDIKSNAGQEIADIVQKLRDDAKTE